MNKLEKTKPVFWMLVGLGLVLFFAHGAYLDKKAKERWMNESFQGRVTDIEFKQTNRGLPSLRIKDQWIDLGLSSYSIAPFIEVNDSIVKIQGVKEIAIFKENENGDLLRKVID